MKKAEEVLGSHLVARNDAAESQDPSEEPLDLPSTSIASELSRVLRLVFPRWVVRRDHLDAERLQLGVELVAVVRLVADHSLRECVDEAGLDGGSGERRFMSLTTSNPNGERKTMRSAIAMILVAEPRRFRPT